MEMNSSLGSRKLVSCHGFYLDFYDVLYSYLLSDDSREIQKEPPMKHEASDEWIKEYSADQNLINFLFNYWSHFKSSNLFPCLLEVESVGW